MFDWLRFWRSDKNPAKPPQPDPVQDRAQPNPEPEPEPVLVRGRAWKDTSFPVDSNHPPSSFSATGLLDRLKHRDAQVRAAAALELAGAGAAARSAIPALLGAALDVESTVRTAALTALEQLDARWPVSPEAVLTVSDLIRGLDSRFTEVWQQALTLLTRIGTPAVPALVSAISDATRESSVVMCARALGRIGASAAASVPVLAHVLSDSRDHVRREAAEALAAIGAAAEPAVSVLAHALADRDVGVRQACARALARIGPESGIAVPALIPLTADRIESVRTVAIDALIAIGPRAVSALTEVVAAVDRARLAAVLQQELELSAWWRQPLDPKYAHEPTKAIRNINWFFQESEDEVARVELIHSGALKALGRIGPAAGACVGAVAAALADGSRAVRAAAAEALGRIGPAALAVSPVLARALADPAESVRRCAAAALPAVDVEWAQRAETVPLLASWAENLQTSGDRGTSAAEALRLAGAAAVPHLVSALAATDRVARENAARVLGLLGPIAVAAVPAITRALRDAHGWVQAAAAAALKQVTATTPAEK